MFVQLALVAVELPVVAVEPPVEDQSAGVLPHAVPVELPLIDVAVKMLVELSGAPVWSY